MTNWQLLRSLVGWTLIGAGMKAMHPDDPDLDCLSTAVHISRARMERERAVRAGELPERCSVCRDGECEGPAWHEIHGSWGPRDVRRWFVAGAKWWEFVSTGATMWASDTDKAEAEAERRYVHAQGLSAKRG